MQVGVTRASWFTPFPRRSSNPGKGADPATGDPRRVQHESTMSYQRYRRHPSQAMGDVVGTVTTVLDVATDPAMPEVVCRIQQLQAIDHGQPVGVCAETMPGIGTPWIQRILPVLRGYVYAQQNQWVYPVALMAAIGIPMWIGYELGRGK